MSTPVNPSQLTFLAGGGEPGAIAPAADANGVRIDMAVDPAVAPMSGDPERCSSTD